MLGRGGRASKVGVLSFLAAMKVLESGQGAEGLGVKSVISHSLVLTLHTAGPKPSAESSRYRVVCLFAVRLSIQDKLLVDRCWS